MTKKEKKNGAPVFTARNYPPASFSLPMDGRKGKGLRQDRRNLFLQVSSYGLKPWPSVAELAEMMGWRERWTYRILSDLKELGCLPNAKDANGRKYTGRRGTRVRSLDIPVLPLPGSSPWLAVTDCLTSDGTPLLVQFVNRPVEGLHDSPSLNAEGLHDSVEGLHDSSLGLHDSIEGLHARSADERTNLERTNLERTNPQPKEQFPAAVAESEGQDIAGAIQEMKDAAKTLPDNVLSGLNREGIEEQVAAAAHNVELHRLVMAWKLFMENRNFSGLRQTAFECFKRECGDWLEKADQELAEQARRKELVPMDAEQTQQYFAEMYKPLDATYYADKLADAKADYEANGALFDEPTRAEMLAQIEEYEAKVAELTP